MERQIEMCTKPRKKTFSRKYLYMKEEIIIFARDLNILQPRIEHFDDVI